MTIELEEGSSSNWKQMLISHKDGSEIADVERNSHRTDTLVADEIREFLQEIVDGKPTTAVGWLTEYLQSVKTIYCFQILPGADQDDGYQLLSWMTETILDDVGGIIQADGEGFSNEEGYQILWQFSDSAKGKWWMAVRKKGKWVRFQMDIGNKKHRAAFLKGDVPDGVKVQK